LALSKERKNELVAQYIEQLERGQGIILTDYKGLDVSEMSRIRNALRPIGGQFQVVKNRLLLLALKEVGISLPDEWLVEPTAVGFCYDEVPAAAKILVDTAKDTKVLRIKGGWMGAAPLSADQVSDIADLPSREVLLAQALGAINAPASQVVGVIASGIRQIVNVLQAYVEKLEESAGSELASEMAQAAEPA
jgi:large subunit ribosomal protein L10